MKVILTSTSDRAIEFNHRMPNGQVATVVMPAYALNHEVYFADESTFESFKKQNIIYFTGDKPILIEGKATGSKAERIFTEREKGNAKKINADAKASVDKIASATKDSGVKLGIEVETTGGDK